MFAHLRRVTRRIQLPSGIGLLIKRTTEQFQNHTYFKIVYFKRRYILEVTNLFSFIGDKLYVYVITCSNAVRSEAVTAVTMKSKSTISRDVTPCSR